MPVMKGLLAPQNTFLDTIATRFDGTRRAGTGAGPGGERGGSALGSAGPRQGEALPPGSGGEGRGRSRYRSPRGSAGHDGPHAVPRTVRDRARCSPTSRVASVLGSPAVGAGARGVCAGALSRCRYPRCLCRCHQSVPVPAVGAGAAALSTRDRARARREGPGGTRDPDPLVSPLVSHFVSHLAGRDQHKTSTGSLQPPPMAQLRHREHPRDTHRPRCWAGLVWCEAPWLTQVSFAQGSSCLGC